MPTINKFVIALCPATPCYLHSATGRFSTSDKAKAREFDTFDAAMEVALTIHGWGGASRVEQIAVEVPAPQPLATDDEIKQKAEAAKRAKRAKRAAAAEATTQTRSTRLSLIHHEGASFEVICGMLMIAALLAMLWTLAAIL